MVRLQGESGLSRQNGRQNINVLGLVRFRFLVPFFSFFLGCSRHVWVSFSLVYMVTTIARARKSLCAEKTALRVDTMDESAGGGCTHARTHTPARHSIFFPVVLS
jgi:hypothetical protein